MIGSKNILEKMFEVKMGRGSLIFIKLHLQIV